MDFVGIGSDVKLFVIFVDFLYCVGYVLADVICFVFGFEYGDDVFGGVIVEELFFVFFMESDVMVFD